MIMTINRLKNNLLLMVFVPALFLSGCASDDALKELEKGLLGGSSGSVSVDEITRGLKEALTKGSNSVVGQLGARDGFNADPAIRVPLPKSLAKARDYAAKVGLDGSFNELEVRLNRAAEAATPKAKSLFIGAIRSMSVQDAKGILKGPDDAATRYFEGKTRNRLAGSMRPLVDQSLAEVGAVNYFNRLMKQYNSIPLAPKVDADLTSHVVGKGMDGIFTYLAKEEADIRKNPLKRTTALLKRVFAAQ